MNQIPSVQPCYPVQSVPYALPQPSYNAVKIDVHNPSVNAPGAPYMQCPCPPQPQAQNPAVSAPIYNYPQAPIYYPQPQVPADQTAVQPGYYPYPPMGPVQYPTPVPAPAQYPPVIEQQNVNYPPQQVPQPAPQTTDATQVPEPQVSNAPVIEEPAAVEPAIDINEFIAKLSNPSFESQFNAMEGIAGVFKEQPQNAPALVDKQVYKALNDIINYDSSNLEGPSQKQIDIRQKILQGEKVSEEDKTLADTMSPKELAERNKSYALFSIALLDKLYAQEVKKLANTTVPLTELPEIVTVVNQLKDNPNPMVRISAIEALGYIQDPEYKKDLTTLFNVATNDQDADVAEAAKDALSKLA